MSIRKTMTSSLVVLLLGAGLTVSGCEKKTEADAPKADEAPAAAEKADPAAPAADKAAAPAAADKAAEAPKVAEPAKAEPAAAPPRPAPAAAPAAAADPAVKPQVNIGDGAQVDPAQLAALGAQLGSKPNTAKAKGLVDTMAANMQKMLTEIKAANGDKEKIKEINEKFKKLNEEMSKEGEAITATLSDEEKKTLEGYAQAKISPLVGELLQTMLSANMAGGEGGGGLKPAPNQPAAGGNAP